VTREKRSGHDGSWTCCGHGSDSEEEEKVDIWRFISPQEEQEERERSK